MPGASSAVAPKLFQKPVGPARLAPANVISTALPGAAAQGVGKPSCGACARADAAASAIQTIIANRNIKSLRLTCELSIPSRRSGAGVPDIGLLAELSVVKCSIALAEINRFCCQARRA